MTNICLFLNKINKIGIKKKMQSCDFIFLSIQQYKKPYIVLKFKRAYFEHKNLLF